MPAAHGYRAKVGIGTSAPVTTALEFVSESLAITETYTQAEGVIGRRGHNSERTRLGQRSVAGSLVLQPSPLEWDAILPWALGGTKSGDSVPLADTLTDRVITVDRVVKVLTYTGCKVSSLEISATEGSPVQATVNVVGIDESVGNSGTFPAISIDLTGPPYVMADCVLTVGGNAYQFASLTLTIDNGLDPRYFNSLTATRINETDRIVTVNLSLPYGDAAALYGLGVSGAAVVVTFTNGTRSISASMPAVQFPKQSAQMDGRREYMLPLVGEARRLNGADEVTFSNDSTV